MFTEDTFSKFKISTKEAVVGDLTVNNDLLKQYDFYHPFTRINYFKEVTKYGTRDALAIEQYIVNCLNDYYVKLVNNTNIEERNKMLDKYVHLYGMWRELYTYKNAQDLISMNNMYDMFLYELYIIGYVSS